MMVTNQRAGGSPAQSSSDSDVIDPSVCVCVCVRVCVYNQVTRAGNPGC